MAHKPLNADRMKEIVGLICENGNSLEIAQITGLKLTSIDRYVRDAKTAGLLVAEVHLVGSQFYCGDQPMGQKSAEEEEEEEGGIAGMVARQKIKRGYMGLTLPKLRKGEGGTHVTIDLGDLHCSDEDFLHDTFFSVLHEAVERVKLIPDIGWFTIRGLGDWITGKGIFRGQEARNITNHMHWQTLLGGYLFTLIRDMFAEILPDDVDIEFEYIKGNHDQADGGAVNLGYYLCNEALASFGVRVKYCGTESIANYGTEENPVWSCCVHGFGGGEYSPHSNALMTKLGKRIANLNSENDRAITELRHGHTHWLNGRGLRFTRRLTVYCTGGFQRNKRPELGQAQRPTGAILTIASASSYNTEEIYPCEKTFVDEINQKDLEFMNMERTGKMLSTALAFREKHLGGV